MNIIDKGIIKANLNGRRALLKRAMAPMGEKLGAWGRRRITEARIIMRMGYLYFMFYFRPS
jgi:hypothetical protein